MTAFFYQFGRIAFQKTIGIPMGTNCAPLISDIACDADFLFMNKYIKLLICFIIFFVCVLCLVTNVVCVYGLSILDGLLVSVLWSVGSNLVGSN